MFRVKNVDVETPTLQSIPMVNEFPDLFPEDLLGLPPELEVEFGINVLPDTQPILIHFPKNFPISIFSILQNFYLSPIK